MIYILNQLILIILNIKIIFPDKIYLIYYKQ